MPNDEQAEALAKILAPLVAEQVKTQVEEQVQGIVKKNDELLAKLADKKDILVETQKIIEDAKADFESRKPDDTAGQRKAGDPVILTRSDARNVAKYQEAKRLAEKNGVPLQISDDRIARQEHKLDGQTHIETESTMYIHSDGMKVASDYKRLKATAQDKHLKIVTLTDWNDLPDSLVPSDGE